MTREEAIEFKGAHPSNYTYLLKVKHGDTYSEILDFAEKIGLAGVPFPQKFYHWAHGLTEVPKCEVCGKPCAFSSMGKWEYSKFCSRLCARRGKSTLEKRKATTLAKYGVEFTTQAKEVKEKVRDTVREKYGVDCTLQVQSVKDKIKTTNLVVRGVEYPMMSDEVKQKRVKTNINRFGVEYPMQSEVIRDKFIKTNMERYGNSVSPSFIDAMAKRNQEKRLAVYDDLPNRFPNVMIFVSREDFGGLTGENDWECKICGAKFHTSGYAGLRPTCECQRKSEQKDMYDFVKRYAPDAVLNYRPFDGGQPGNRHLYSIA